MFFLGKSENDPSRTMATLMSRAGGSAPARPGQGAHRACRPWREGRRPGLVVDQDVVGVRCLLVPCLSRTLRSDQAPGWKVFHSRSITAGLAGGVAVWLQTPGIRGGGVRGQSSGRGGSKGDALEV